MLDNKMRIVCDNCNQAYKIPHEKLPDESKKVKCKQCGHLLTIPSKRDQQSEQLTTTEQPSSTCPQCGNARMPDSKECDSCGIIYGKFELVQKRRKLERETKNTKCDMREEEKKLKKKERTKSISRKLNTLTDKIKKTVKAAVPNRNKEKKAFRCVACKKVYRTSIEQGDKPNPICIKCGGETVPISPTHSKVEGNPYVKSTDYRKGWELDKTLIGIGAVALVFSLAMDTSVETGYGTRVVNLGLINDQQNYIFISVSILIIGVILYIFNRNKANNASPQTSDSPDMVDTKTCPYCAETIQKKAIICRYCKRDLDV